MKKRFNLGIVFSLCLTLIVGPLASLAAVEQKAVPSRLVNPRANASLRPAASGSSVKRIQETFPNGRTSTLLSDGGLLLIGGQGDDGPSAGAAIKDLRTAEVVPVASGLSHARAWHTATILPDGRVLVVGGVGADGQMVAEAEVFDSKSKSFEAVSSSATRTNASSATKRTAFLKTPRAHHTATLLTDGRVLISGGLSERGKSLKTAELLDPLTWSTRTLKAKLRTARSGHTATLLPSGEVLLSGGLDKQGKLLNDGDTFDPRSQTFTAIDATAINDLEAELQSPNNEPRLEASLPEQGSYGVAADARIALRFSKRLRVESISNETLNLTGPYGSASVTIVPAEAGMLAFIIPELPLLPGATYTLEVTGQRDRFENSLPLTTISFTTAAGVESSGESREDEDWIPDAKAFAGDWRTGREDSAWRSLPPLQAEEGVTALSGQVLTLTGKPLANVTLTIGDQSTRSDQTGRFLLTNLGAGHHELEIDGKTANRRSKTYGFFEAGVDVDAGRTSVLSYTIWMPRIDTAHTVRIPSPASTEVVVTTPRIPGLEVRIPAGTVIRDHNWRVVTELSITPIPVDRPPFPLPRNIYVPIYFTVQPGGAYIGNIKAEGPKGARLIYPNYKYEEPGSRMNFWHYDPEEKGWHIYGHGSVTQDAKQVNPDPGVAVYEFTGAMINAGMSPPEEGPCGTQDGDPIDLGTGLFVLSQTDLFLPDVMPLDLTRTYRPRDTANRAFGRGATHPYAIFLYSAQQWQEADLVLPDGARIHYPRISPGTGFQTAVFEHTATPTRFYKSIIKWNGDGWDLKLKDGSVYVFGESAPLQSIRDRYGNQTTLTWSQFDNGNITRVTSPNGRWIDFTYDAGNRITQAKDNTGRIVGYTYDASGRLWKVTNPIGGVIEFTYDSSHRMLTIKDAKGIVYVTNQYDANGRINLQTMADGTTYQFAYTLDGSGKVTQTDVTDQRGSIRRVTFNSNLFPLTDTYALGTPQQQTISYERLSGTNLVSSITDQLGRRTEFAYDSLANLTSVTDLAGTSEAVTGTFTYDPTFSEVTSTTDPLNHTTTFAYDSRGSLTSVSDSLGNQTTYTHNSAGQVLTVTDPVGKTTQFTYDRGDLVGVTGPLGEQITRFVDAAGRVVSVSNSLGQNARIQYDAWNRPLTVTDPFQGVTSFAYDANSNLLSVTDALGRAISYTYNNMDRVITRTDPLQHSDAYVYDAAGNPQQVTDRKSQVTSCVYDALERLTLVTYADGSTTAHTYDSGNRLTQVVDSVSGTITFTYDNLDRLTSEITPRGTISYSYDSAGRCTAMTISGQSTINYTYDNADRLTQMSQGTSTVTVAYDQASRTTSETRPNGVITEYGYDDSSRLTSITYKKDSTVLGNLTYEYDAASRQTRIGGSYARTGLPQAITSTSYNAANQQIGFGSQTLTYDLNGNLTSDGVNSYVWNAREQLASISGPGLSASFQYDAFGRRFSKTLNGSATAHLFDGANIVQEQTGGSASANVLTGGLDHVLTRTDSSGTVTPLLDGLGSIIGLVNSAGSVQTEYTYEPFGKTTTSGATNNNPSQYTGRENDGTGLYYYRARYYSPTLQRFISEDPIGLLGGMDVYAYVGNDPINFSDPYGLERLPGGVSFIVGLKDSTGGTPLGGIGTPAPPFADILGYMGYEVEPCAYKWGVYTGIAIQVVAAAVSLAGAVRAVAGGVRAFRAGRALRAAGANGSQPASPGNRNLPFSDPGRETGVNRTLDRMEKGGPHPYAQDGTVFRNKENLLPRNPSGKYREYTVETPGASTRGARRIVEGPTGKTYYTDDHYRSFVRIDPRRRK